MVPLFVFLETNNVENASIFKNSDWLIERFRPNLVIDGPDAQPLEEDFYEAINIGSLKLRVSGACNRCSMVNVDKTTLKVVQEPLKTLSTYRRDKVV